MTFTDEDGARWDAATSLAEGVTDDGFSKRRGRILHQIVALIIGSWIVGTVIALLFLPTSGTGHQTHDGHSNQQLTAQFIFLGIGFVVGLGGFISGRRTGHYTTRWSAVISPLNRAEKKSVRRQINGKEQPDQAHLPVILAIANQNRRATLGIAPIYFAIVLFALATAIGSDQVWIKILELAVSLLFVGIAVQLAVLYKRAGRFITQYSTP